MVVIAGERAWREKEKEEEEEEEEGGAQYLPTIRAESDEIRHFDCGVNKSVGMAGDAATPLQLHGLLWWLLCAGSHTGAPHALVMVALVCSAMSLSA
jgi:hypothetical protein